MPVAHSFRAEPGQRVWLDGCQYEIRAIAGDAGLRLISPAAPADRQVITLPLAMLISDPTFRPCARDEDPGLDGDAARVHRELTDTVAAMDGLARADPDEAGRLAGLQEHMLELTTGYRSGDPAAPAPGEPREGFDPSLPMRQRVAAKAAEFGIGASTLWYRLRKWRGAGSTTFGLVDRRSTTARLSYPLAAAVLGKNLQQSALSGWQVAGFGEQPPGVVQGLGGLRRLGPARALRHGQLRARPAPGRGIPRQRACGTLLAAKRELRDVLGERQGLR